MGPFSMSINTPPPPRLLDQVRAVLRRKHYSLRTEEAYVGWVKRYVLFHDMCSKPLLAAQCGERAGGSV
jgi:hypothetical protein